jgi:hypothetical protein
VYGNHFDGDRVAIVLRDALSTEIGINHFPLGMATVRCEGKGEVVPSTTGQEQQILATLPERPPGREPAFLPAGTPRGRAMIFVDDWGPYDFEGLRAYPALVEGVAAARVHLLGPHLPYRIDSIAGEIGVEPSSGTLPATVRVRPADDAGGVVPFAFVALTDRGEITVRGALLALPWTVRYHAWTDAGPRQPPADWEAVRASAPIAEESRGDLDLRFGGGGPGEDLPRDHFATIAMSAFRVPPGRYTLRILSDDGVRVRLDGATVHDDWSWHPTREAAVEVELGEGEHRLEVEHFEIDGHAELGVTLVPAAAPPR